jgi:hypothetical protein
VWRILAEGMGIGVREDKDTVAPLDRAELCAHVARQACVTDRMHVASPQDSGEPEIAKNE